MWWFSWDPRPTCNRATTWKKTQGRQAKISFITETQAYHSKLAPGEVWIRMAHISLYVWVLGPQIRELLGKEQEAWSCWNRSGLIGADEPQGGLWYSHSLSQAQSHWLCLQLANQRWALSCFSSTTPACFYDMDILSQFFGERKGKEMWIVCGIIYSWQA